MKTRVLIFLIMLTSRTILHGQDGSDILYRPANRLGNSYIGDFVHLDFYNRSFHGASIDTITIKIDCNPIKLIEHREDDGFNNWFRKQYFESLDKIDGLAIRVIKSRLDKITTDSIFVTNYLEYYEDDKVVVGKSRQTVAGFSRIIITEVLVSADSHKGQNK